MVPDKGGGLVVGHHFVFNDTATTEIYTLSLHDALPICTPGWLWCRCVIRCACADLAGVSGGRLTEDRKSTRLNSSHANISYAVFCLKKQRIRSSCSICSPWSPCCSAHLKTCLPM